MDGLVSGGQAVLLHVDDGPVSMQVGALYAERFGYLLGRHVNRNVDRKSKTACEILFQTHKEVGMRVIAYWCVRDSESGLLWRAHEVYMLVLVLVLPLTVMAYCYTAICWEIWRVMKRRYQMTSRRTLNPTNIDTESIPMTQRQSIRNNRRVQRQDDQTEEESRTIRQVVKMLVAVVVLFVICWGPILVDNMLTSYGYLPRVKVGTYKHLNTAFQLMAYFNSCINPIVYGFMSKHFRESFLSAACGGWWICCPRRGYRAPVKRHPSLSQTRTTSIRYAGPTKIYATHAHSGVLFFSSLFCYLP
ncbi:hypothetical protein E2986_02331 [Frieseomelitta varia]|uniref:G-protein coupled receptors family 1 profile domain-containing protein n=1 Tax=Frieseomelitta varia TaxID=561572 RepID=A0A833WBY7_9HYME|nr:hypothetical protein E2986_02331 [Frieseomelitta varia]